MLKRNISQAKIFKIDDLVLISTSKYKVFLIPIQLQVYFRVVLLRYYTFDP